MKQFENAYTIEVDRLRAENKDLWEFVNWIVDSWPGFIIGKEAQKIKDKYQGGETMTLNEEFIRYLGGRMVFWLALLAACMVLAKWGGV